MGDVRSDLCPTNGGGFFVRQERGSDVSREPEVQGVRDRPTSSAPATSARTASARWRSPTTTRRSTPAEAKRRIQAGSQGIWRYADFLPFEGRPGDPLEPGLTPLLRADRLAERLGLDAELWIKNDAANPTHSFKDRVVAVAVAKAQELGFDTVACASTGNLANAVAAHAAAAGLDSYVFVPANLEEQKLLATGVYGTNLVGVRGNYDDVNRLCTQLAETPALGLRQRQPAPLLRRGLEDARLRDRRAARLGAARPGRLPDRLRLAVHQARPRLPGVARPRPGRGRAADLQRRPGRGLQPGRDRLRRRLGRLQAAEAGHDRQEPGDRRPGRRPLRGRARPPHRRRRSTRSPTTRSATAISLLAETTGIFTETAGGVTDRRAAQAGRTRRDRRRRARRRLHHRRGPEDARRDPRYVPDARDRPRPRQLRGRVRARR